MGANITGLVFLDTNVLVYAQDLREPAKQAVARPLVRKLLKSGEGAISSQVVQEYCAVALQPHKALKPDDLKLTLSNVLFPMLAHVPDKNFYRKAIDLQALERMNFYDALIVQAAIDLGCQKIYSEDLPTGRAFGGIVVENPFET